MSCIRKRRYAERNTVQQFRMPVRPSVICLCVAFQYFNKMTKRIIILSPASFSRCEIPTQQCPSVMLPYEKTT